MSDKKKNPARIAYAKRWRADPLPGSGAGLCVDAKGLVSDAIIEFRVCLSAYGGIWMVVP